MNPQQFYIPGMGLGNTFPYGAQNSLGLTRGSGLGLFNRLIRGIRSVNWSGLLNNANKTIDVVNQAIPLVRQAGPMMNNMKSMFKLAKAFSNETSQSKEIVNIKPTNTINKKNKNSYHNYPNFFL